MSTRFTPFAKNHSAALSAASSLSTFTPVRISASTSFGVIRSTLLNTSLLIGCTGAVFRITFTPFLQAISTIRSTEDTFVSSWVSRYSAPSRRSSRESTSASVMVLQAPKITTISFWLLFSSTIMRAHPVSVSSEYKTLSFFIPSSVIVFNAISAKESRPSFVTIVTSAPALCAATP